MVSKELQKLVDNENEDANIDDMKKLQLNMNLETRRVKQKRQKLMKIKDKYFENGSLKNRSIQFCGKILNCSNAFRVGRQHVHPFRVLQQVSVI